MIQTRFTNPKNRHLQILSHCPIFGASSEVQVSLPTRPDSRNAPMMLRYVFMSFPKPNVTFKVILVHIQYRSFQKGLRLVSVSCIKPKIAFQSRVPHHKFRNRKIPFPNVFHSLLHCRFN